MGYLAQLKVAEKATPAEFTLAAEAGQVIVAIVPAVESNLVASLQRLAERAQGLVVVLLEGFAPNETPDKFLAQLKGGNLTVISCSRGNLEAAVRRLDNFLFYAGKSPAPVD